MHPRASITGGAGFIGSHLAGEPLQHGWQVTALDAFVPPVTPALAKLGRRGRFAPEATRLVQLAHVLDAIYGRGGMRCAY